MNSNHLMIRMVILLLLGDVLFSSGLPAAETLPARNVILYLAPGLGVHQYQLLEVLSSHENRPLALSRLRRLTMQTSILDALIPDTPGGASTLATGRKSPAGTFSMTSEGEPVPTLLQQAKENGLAVGLVSLGALTDGAITAFAVHTQQSDDYENRARQIYEMRPDVLVGSDQEVFERLFVEEDVSLLQKMAQEGYTIIEGDRDQFLRAKPEGRLAAFFDHRYRADLRFYPQEPGLQQILFKTMSMLQQNPKGFFLVVETPALDASCRLGDIAGLAHELVELDEAVEAGMRFAANHPRTLIVVASPHETGNFLVVEDQLDSFCERYRNIRSSPVYADAQIGRVTDVLQVMRVFRDIVGIPALEQFQLADVCSTPQGEERVQVIARIMSHFTLGGTFVQPGPSGRTVPCFVYGPTADTFPESLENSDLAPLIARALGLQWGE